MSTATAARPLTEKQTDFLRMMLDLIRANGGTTRLERSPDALIKRGLIRRTKHGIAGAAGCGARYTLTADGMAIANVAEQARIERKAAMRQARDSV
jgi:hypothetical protein